MKLYLTSGTPSIGDTIEFLKNLLPEDKNEFLFGKANECEAINAFLNALPFSDTYALRENHNGKIIAMGGLVPADKKPMTYIAWLLCAEGSEKHPLAIYKSVRKILESTGAADIKAAVYHKSFCHIRFIKKGFGFRRIKNINKDYDVYSWGGLKCAI